MEVSVDVHKIIKCTTYIIVFFLFSRFFFFFFWLVSGESIDDMLVRLSLIKQIIQDANLMSISFSVKHSQAFRES